MAHQHILGHSVPYNVEDMKILQNSEDINKAI